MSAHAFGIGPATNPQPPEPDIRVDDLDALRAQWREEAEATLSEPFHLDRMLEMKPSQDRTDLLCILSHAVAGDTGPLEIARDIFIQRHVDRREQEYLHRG